MAEPALILLLCCRVFVSLGVVADDTRPVLGEPDVEVVTASPWASTLRVSCPENSVSEQCRCNNVWAKACDKAWFTEDGTCTVTNNFVIGFDPQKYLGPRNLPEVVCRAADFPVAMMNVDSGEWKNNPSVTCPSNTKIVGCMLSEKHFSRTEGRLGVGEISESGACTAGGPCPQCRVQARCKTNLESTPSLKQMVLEALKHRN